MGCWDKEKVELVADSVGPDIAQKIIDNLGEEGRWKKVERQVILHETSKVQVPVQLPDIGHEIWEQNLLVPVDVAKIFLSLARCNERETLRDFLKSLAGAN